MPCGCLRRLERYSAADSASKLQGCERRGSVSGLPRLGAAAWRLHTVVASWLLHDRAAEQDLRMLVHNMK
eukprot:COSAG01_NODE_774_length_13702_cov_11.108726_22_plen_70_part_00